MFVQNLLRDKRIELDLTMKQIADYVGVSEATVSRWESGDIANMKRDKIYSLAKILQISPLDILGWEEEQPAETEGLSELAMQIARLVDRLPPESRRLLLLQVQALAQAESNQAAPEESSKSQ